MTPLRFASLPLGSHFRFLNSPRLNGLWLDGEMVKTGANTFGPTEAEPIWELAESELLWPVKAIKELKRAA